jgi:hypothetical protein
MVCFLNPATFRSPRYAQNRTLMSPQLVRQLWKRDKYLLPDIIPNRSNGSEAEITPQYDYLKSLLSFFIIKERRLKIDKYRLYLFSLKPNLHKS